MLDVVGSLAVSSNSRISARIPHPTSLRSATFPSGEGITATDLQNKVVPRRNFAALDFQGRRLLF